MVDGRIRKREKIKKKKKETEKEIERRKGHLDSQDGNPLQSVTPLTAIPAGAILLLTESRNLLRALPTRRPSTEKLATSSSWKVNLRKRHLLTGVTQRLDNLEGVFFFFLSRRTSFNLTLFTITLDAFTDTLWLVREPFKCRSRHKIDHQTFYTEFPGVIGSLRV